MDDKLAFASARTLASMVREKKVGAVELLDFYLGRIDRLNPRVNAVILQRADEARKEAAACDAMTERGESRGLAEESAGCCCVHRGLRRVRPACRRVLLLPWGGRGSSAARR